MEKITVLTQSLKMFKKYGIKSIRMDDIAKELNISKRTLYENFDSKEFLLNSILREIEVKDNRKLNRILNSDDELFERFKLLKQDCYNILRSKDNLFYFDLKKFYQNSYLDHIEKITSCIANVVHSLIETAHKEELIRKEITPQGAYEFFKIELNSLIMTNAVTKKIEKDYMLKIIFDYYIRSAVSEKGQKYISSNNIEL